MLPTAADQSHGNEIVPQKICPVKSTDDDTVQIVLTIAIMYHIFDNLVAGFPFNNLHMNAESIHLIHVNDLAKKNSQRRTFMRTSHTTHRTTKSIQRHRHTCNYIRPV